TAPYALSLSRVITTIVLAAIEPTSLCNQAKRGISFHPTERTTFLAMLGMTSVDFVYEPSAVVGFLRALAHADLPQTRRCTRRLRSHHRECRQLRWRSPRASNRAARHRGACPSKRRQVGCGYL